MPRTTVTANSAFASLGRYWRDSRPRHCGRADIPAWRPKKSHYCINISYNIWTRLFCAFNHSFPVCFTGIGITSWVALSKSAISVISWRFRHLYTARLVEFAFLLPTTRVTSFVDWTHYGTCLRDITWDRELAMVLFYTPAGKWRSRMFA